MATQNFRTAFNGFNREDVVHYIEFLNSQHAAEINRLNSELDLLRSRPAPKDNTSTLEDQATRIDRLVDRCTSLEKDLITLRIEKAQLETQIGSIPSAGSDIEDQLSAALAENEELKARLSEAADTDSGINEKLSAALTENDQLKNRISEAEEQLSAAQAENAQLMADLGAARNRQAALESRKNDELEAYRRAERAERLAQERASQMYQQANGIIADATCRVTATADQLGQLSGMVMDQLEQLRQAIAGSNQALKDAAACMSAIRPEEE